VVIAREVCNERIRIVEAFHRHGSEAQPGRPTFGTRAERLEGRRPEGYLVLSEQDGRLLLAESELRCPNLAELIGEPVPVKRQRRIDPAHEHQPQPRSRVPDQVGEPVQDRGAGFRLEVVEDQHCRARSAGELGREIGDEGDTAIL
jgi:hypothetical protein